MTRCLFCNSERVRKVMTLVKSTGIAYWKCHDCGAQWAE